MASQNFDTGCSAVGVWTAPKLVMLTAVGQSEGGLIAFAAEKQPFPTKLGGTVRGTVYGVSG